MQLISKNKLQKKRFLLCNWRIIKPATIKIKEGEKNAVYI